LFFPKVLINGSLTGFYGRCSETKISEFQHFVRGGSHAPERFRVGMKPKSGTSGLESWNESVSVLEPHVSSDHREQRRNRVPLSAVAGTFGWRAWYFVTAVSVGTFLFFIHTHFVD
jgi:hypothetical protein